MSGSAVLRPHSLPPRPVASLIAEFGFEATGQVSGLELTGVTADSRQVEPGDLYVGLPGARSHGAAFAAQARDLGAKVILTDAAGAALVDGVMTVLVTEDPRQALAPVSAWLYRSAELEAARFAVTGTNGKTSTVYLLDGILAQLGVSAALTTTAERKVGGETLVSGLTTPEAHELHAFLARAAEVEARAVIVEVSSHALSRHRVDEIVFDVAGFTNLSHDHLDDYGSMEEYFSAKAELFTPEHASAGVIVVDGEWGRALVHRSRIPVTTVGEPGTDADWTWQLTSEGPSGTGFTVTGPDGRSISTVVPLFGAHMASNAALAIVMLVTAGFDPDEIDQVLTRDEGISAYVPGRLELVSGASPVALYVDYGHSPDAFLVSLAALRKFITGKVIMVFGADGDRDPFKRSDMAAIAARGSDIVVITDYHPRFEDAASIRATLLDGARAAVPDIEIYEVPDPATAIRRAVELAEPGDAILYAGPGHEDYHEVRGEHIPYAARAESRAALIEAGWL